MNRYLMEATMMLAIAQAGEQKLNDDLRQRACDKWELSKRLPRKAKKLIRKDAMLDLAFAVLEYTNAINI